MPVSFIKKLFLIRRCEMNWLKDFFFCNTWRELFVAAVLASMGLIVFWFLLVIVFVLFG